MPRVGPIGRERELGELVEAAQAAATGEGSVVFLAGPTGSGKRFLLKALAVAVAELPEEGRPEFVSVLCFETGTSNPLGPFGEVLRALTSKERRGAKARRTFEIIREIAPPVAELIPVIGKLAALGVKTAANIGVYAFGGDREAQQLQLASDVANALRGIAAQQPLVLAVGDAQWIDAASCQVIERLAQDSAETPLLLVVGYDPDLVTDTHVLGRVRARTAPMPGVSGIELDPLDVAGVAAILAERYGDPPHELLAAWLHEQTEGNPLFLTQYLARLEEQGVLRRDDDRWTLDGTISGRPGAWTLDGALAAAETPESLLTLLAPRVEELEDEERSLLESGAVQGRRFLSTVLVRLLNAEARAIHQRLARIAERRGLIEPEDVEDWWSDRSALYAFDPGLLRELIYARRYTNSYERRLEHGAVAEALEALIEDDDPPPRQALLEIAHHYEAAGKPIEAARRLVEVADACFAEGADHEAAVHADRAVGLLREPVARLKDAERPEGQRLLARAILLVLLGGEPAWSAEGEGAGERLLELAAEAERAAEAAGDTKLRANARYATAHVQLVYAGLEEGLSAYREALELARAARDPLAEFAILLRYGHHLDSVSLEQGREQLLKAHELLTSGALDAQLGPRQRAAEAASLEALLGAAAYDLGRYGEALELLPGSVAGLKEARRREEAAWAVSFLAQLQTAIGAWEEAEATLRDGLELLADLRGKLGASSFLRGLLGRVYLEWDPPRLEHARAELAPAYEESGASGHKPTMPLVAAMWAGLLLAEATPEAVGEAERALREAQSFGWARAEIAVSSTLAQVLLAAGRPEDALEPSTKAVTELDANGGAVPVVHSEEVLWTQAHVLEAAGSAEEAKEYAQRAAEVVRAKSQSLPDADRRERFEQRVRLSREILAG